MTATQNRRHSNNALATLSKTISIAIATIALIGASVHSHHAHAG